MCLFIETLRIENGRICHAEYHNRRMNRTRLHHFGGPLGADGWREWDVNSLVVPEGYRARTRCRILYGREVQKVEYFPYEPRRVESLQLVEADGMEYRYKYADRSLLDALFAQRGSADEVLIVRNGLLTDTSIANIALWNGQEWHTPSLPLLEGTCRMRLLEQGVVRERDIRVEHLREYRRIRLFNAMLHWGEVELDCEAIRCQNR